MIFDKESPGLRIFFYCYLLRVCGTSLRLFLFFTRHVAHAYGDFFNKDFMDESEVWLCTSF